MKYGLQTITILLLILAMVLNNQASIRKAKDAEKKCSRGGILTVEITSSVLGGGRKVTCVSTTKPKMIFQAPPLGDNEI